MAGDALPAAFGEYPGVGEASPVLIGLALVTSFGVIYADDYGGVRIHADLEVLNSQAGDVELRVFDVGQKLAFVADFAIVLRIDEFAANHEIKGTGIAAHLSFIPQVFHHQELGLL